MSDSETIHPKLEHTLRNIPHSIQERLADALPGLLALAEALTPAAVEKEAGELPLLEGMAQDGLIHPDATRLEPPEAGNTPPLKDQVLDRASTQGRDLPGYQRRKPR